MWSCFSGFEAPGDEGEPDWTCQASARAGPRALSITAFGPGSLSTIERQAPNIKVMVSPTEVSDNIDISDCQGRRVAGELEATFASAADAPGSMRPSCTQNHKPRRADSLTFYRLFIILAKPSDCSWEEKMIEKRKRAYRKIYISVTVSISIVSKGGCG